jgi:hypothetical protein
MSSLEGNLSASVLIIVRTLHLLNNERSVATGDGLKNGGLASFTTVIEINNSYK